MKNKTLIEFDLPEGYMVPEGTAGGEVFEELCRFRVRAGNKVCLEQIGDVPFEAYADGSGDYRKEVEARAAKEIPMG